MKKTIVPKPARKPRADAQRNREHILKVAKQVFTRRGANASMDEIAKRARIGPGTLYRHFPTRDDLLSAVYTVEIDRLAEAQRKFSADLAPIDALRAWMLVFVDHIAAKKIILPALNTMMAGPAQVFKHSTIVMQEAVDALRDRAVASGELRPDVDPMDMLRALYGISSAGSSDEWPDKARSFVDVLIQGSKA